MMGLLRLTFLAKKNTIIRATTKQPAAICVVRCFVDARINTIPQNDEPRSGVAKNRKMIKVTTKSDAMCKLTEK